MKRVLVLVMTSMLLVCLVAGCGGGVKTYVDAEETINTSVGQEFIIALDANPTTGYNWEESYDDTVLSLVEKKYNPDEKAPGLVGSGGTQCFQFKALKKGTTEITLTYKRSWETGSAEQKVFTADIS
jgi:Predicted secreted protein